MVVGVVGEAGAVERHIGEQKRQPQTIFWDQVYARYAAFDLRCLVVVRRMPPERRSSCI